METKRVSLPSILATRDPSTGKDGLLVNCYTEQGPDEKRIVRRPGFISEALIPGSTCNAQGAYFFAGQPIYLVCDTLIGPGTEGLPPAGVPQTIAQGRLMATDPVTGLIWANVPGVGTAVYDSHTLLHLDTVLPPTDTIFGGPCNPSGNVCFEQSSRRVWIACGNPGNSPSIWAIDADTHQIVVTLPAVVGWPFTIVNESDIATGVMRVFSSQDADSGLSYIFSHSGNMPGHEMRALSGVTDSLEIPGGYVIRGNISEWIRIVKGGISNDFTIGGYPVFCYSPTDGHLYVASGVSHVLVKIDLTSLIMSTVTTLPFGPSSICFDEPLGVLWATDGGSKTVKSLDPATGDIIRTVSLTDKVYLDWWSRLRTIPDTTWLVSDSYGLIRGINVT